MSSGGRGRVLDHDRIVRAAFEQIEVDGADRFSMRRLGARLGVDPMAVYYHVRSKSALLDAMVAAVYDEVDVASLPWDESGATLVAEFARRFRDALCRHPAMVAVVATRPVRDERQMRMGERAIARLVEDGCTPRLALTLVRSVQALTIGLVLAGAVQPAGGAAAGAADVAEQIAEQNLVTMGAAAEGGHRPDEAFETALAALLDGFARRAD